MPNSFRSCHISHWELTKTYFPAFWHWRCHQKAVLFNTGHFHHLSCVSSINNLSSFISACIPSATHGTVASINDETWVCVCVCVSALCSCRLSGFSLTAIAVPWKVPLPVFRQIWLSHFQMKTILDVLWGLSHALLLILFTCLFHIQSQHALGCAKEQKPTGASDLRLFERWSQMIFEGGWGWCGGHECG